MRKIVVVLCLMLLWLNCGHNIEDNSRVSLKTGKILFSQWDEMFEAHEIIPFFFDDPEQEIISIGQMQIIPGGDYIIMDGKANNILLFDAAGKFKKIISGKGEGPGEHFFIGASIIDKNNNFYFFDPAKRGINKFRTGDYTFTGHLTLPTYIQDLLMDDDGNFIVYTTSEPDILFKIDPRGNVINKALRGDQESFRLFSARFQMGRLCAIPDGLCLVSYPEEYKIYLCDYQFNIKKIFYADATSKYFQDKAVFPSTLSPYDFSPKHAKWWGESFRPGPIYYLGNGLFLLEILKFTNLSADIRVNIHDFNGNTYAAGLEVPFDGIIRFVKDGYVYVVEESKFDESNNVIPLKLHRFKLKDKLNQGH